MCVCVLLHFVRLGVGGMLLCECRHLKNLCVGACCLARYSTNNSRHTVHNVTATTTLVHPPTDEATSDLDQFLQSADQFYTSLLEQLQTTHRFTLADYVSGKVDFPSKTRQRAVSLL